MERCWLKPDDDVVAAAESDCCWHPLVRNRHVDREANLKPFACRLRFFPYLLLPATRNLMTLRCCCNPLLARPVVSVTRSRLRHTRVGCQPRLSDKNHAHGLKSATSYGLCSLHHCAAIEFDTVVSGVVAKPLYHDACVERCGWNVTVKVPATSRQITGGSLRFSRT